MQRDTANPPGASGGVQPELNTADVTLISHAHGRKRRAERDITKSNLQAAVEHGAHTQKRCF
jgi:hypothetical protein